MARLANLAKMEQQVLLAQMVQKAARECQVPEGNPVKVVKLERRGRQVQKDPQATLAKTPPISRGSLKGHRN
jgi:hypothetical protein